MINNIKDTNFYKLLNLNNQTHAYLFYSSDQLLNDNTASIFAKSLICENNTACNVCNACKQFDSLSHPDLFILNNETYKVEDVNILISKLASKPISASKKVFVILNFDKMNETAQNKLLKSFEEPNDSTVFVLSATKIDKLLPTVLSRLDKIFLPKLDLEDKKIIANELSSSGIDISDLIYLDLSLTEMIFRKSSAEYDKVNTSIKNMLFELKTSADIPIVSSNLNVENKELFFKLLVECFESSLKKDYSKIDAEIIDFITNFYPQKAIIKILTLIDNYYKMYASNVNFYYVIDNLLFNILKEKFLCK